MHFPGFSLEAAEYLVDNHKIASLGIDTLSIDHGPFRSISRAQIHFIPRTFYGRKSH